LSDDAHGEMRGGHPPDDRVVFGRPVVSAAEIAEVTRCLQCGWIGPGPRVAAFERALEAATGAAHVRCVSSCTAALTLALSVLGIGPGDEVLVPTMTFVATANAVRQTGADVRLVDCVPGNGLIDLDLAEVAIGPRTRALIPVHLGGDVVDLDRLAALERRHGVLIVEDAAHALGATWRRRPVGSGPGLAAFSFSVSKNVTTIEGGALATGDPELADLAARLARHGVRDAVWDRFSAPADHEGHSEVSRAGFKYTLTDVQAAIGLGQLPRLAALIDERREQARRYDELLDGLPGLTRTPAAAGSSHHLYRVEIAQRRDEVRAALARAGVGSEVHYRALHLHPYYAAHCGVGPADLPVATAMSARTLSLPLGPAVTAGDQRRVARALETALLHEAVARAVDP
jgi:dTDP-4-amino-4,6-dideoxygalactose transaminase